MSVTDSQSNQPSKKAVNRTQKRMTRTALVVLGMHRSGTSALTRCLSLLGAELPANLMIGGDSNKKGHWEPEYIAQINDRLLAELNSRWDDWRALDLDFLSKGRRSFFKSEIKRILTEEFGKSELFVLKEPRICRLAPLYFETLRSLGAQPKVVFPYRNPVDVARSLHKRNGIEPTIGQLYWLRHICDAEFASRGEPRVFIRYDSLLADWSSEIGRVIDAHELSQPTAKVKREINSFLDADLQSFDDGDDVIKTDPTVSQWTREAYKALHALRENASDVKAMQTLDDVRREFNVLSEAFADHAIALETEKKSALEKASAEAGKARQAEESLQALQQQHQALHEERQNLNTTLDMVRAYQESERQRLLGEAAQAQAQIQELAQRAQSSEEVASASKATLEQTQAALQAKDDAFRIAEASLHAVQARIEKVEAQAAETFQQALARATELGEAKARIELLNGQLGAAQTRAEQFSVDLSEANQANQQLRDTVVHREEELRANQARVGELTELLAREKQALHEIQDATAAKDEELRVNRAHIGELEELLALEKQALHELQDAAAAKDEELRVSKAHIGELTEFLAAAEQAKQTLKSFAVYREEDLRAKQSRVGELTELISGAAEANERLTLELAERTQEVAAAKAYADDVLSELAASREQNGQLEHALNDVRTQLDAAKADIAVMQSEMLQVRDANANLQAQSEASHNETANALAQLAATRRELYAVKTEHSAVLDSASWRVTKPFRKLARLKFRMKEKKHRKIIEDSNLFDADWYVSTNPDLAKVKLAPVLHYLRHGGYEGRDPSAHFSSAEYMARNPDVRSSGINPLVHYLTFGRTENRSPTGNT